MFGLDQTEPLVETLVASMNAGGFTMLAVSACTSAPVRFEASNTSRTIAVSESNAEIGASVESITTPAREFAADTENGVPRLGVARNSGVWKGALKIWPRLKTNCTGVLTGPA